MIKKTLLGIFILFVSTSVYAYTPDEVSPDFLWASSPSLSTGFESLVGIGILDPDAIGSGTSFYFDAIGSYAVNDQFGFSLHIPLVGLASSGNDGFGMGNISFQGTYFIPTSSDLIVGLSTEVAFATATNDANVGTATRNYFRYTDDQWAIVPNVIVGTDTGDLQLTGQVGLPIQILEDNGQFDGDTMEMALSYDIGAAVAISDTRNVWVTVEAGGYSTLTNDSIDNQTEVFGSIGGQYQDDEKSYGLSIAVPFTENVRNIQSVLFYGSFGYQF